MAGKDIIDSLTDPQVIVSTGVTAILGLTSGSVANASQIAALAAATAEAAALSALQSVYDKLTGYEWGLFPNTSSHASTGTQILQALGVNAGDAIFPDALVLQLGGMTRQSTSDAPLEEGSFTSFNKVASPQEIRLTLSFQGTTKQKKKNFIKLQQMQESTDLFSVLMPGLTKANMNVVALEFDRNPNMTSDLLIVNVSLKEVRVYAQTTVMQTKTGLATSYSDQGAKQAQTPTSDQSKAIGTLS